MKLINLMTTLILASLALTPLCAQELTKSSVEEMIEKLDEAASDMDVATISSLIHPGASITMNITINGKAQSMRVTKAQYIQLLEQGMKATTSYDHEVSQVEITVKGNKAFASMRVTERMEINNEEKVGKSIENLTIELIGGKLVITGIVAFTSL